jgi:hypothetical protein
VRSPVARALATSVPTVSVSAPADSALVDNHPVPPADYVWQMWEKIEARKANLR